MAAAPSFSGLLSKPACGGRLMCQLYIELKQLPVRWLYYSDHDMQGGQIATILKSGALATAYNSTRITCPELEWTGPRFDPCFLLYRSSPHNKAFYFA